MAAKSLFPKKVAKWAALPITLVSVPMNVYAATEEEPNSHRVKAHQLPIYNVPPLDSRYIDEKPGRLQSAISSVRKTTSYYINGCKDAYLFVKNGIISSIQFGKDAYVYLKNPPPEFLPKVGVITISGLTGLVLARKGMNKDIGFMIYKSPHYCTYNKRNLLTESFETWKLAFGSRFKKIAYPLGLGTLSISLCYPVQSVLVAKVTGGKVYAASHKTYEAIGSLWMKKPTAEAPLAQEKDTQKVPAPRSGKEHSISGAPKIIQESEEKAKALEMQFDAGTMLPQRESMSLAGEIKMPSARPDVLKAPKFKPDPRLMDHGQSSPEDVDMYSTRS